jgi:nitroreductase
MSGEELTEKEILPLFEAARWAPSSSNAQPWRFIYARRNTHYWNSFFELLIDFNKSWCVQAALLGVIVSRKLFEKNNQPSATHAFDTGAAWENLFLEGSSRGLVVHGIGGFDYQKAKENLRIPEEYEVLAMFAVGKRAPVETLSLDLQKREVPSGRKSVSEFVFEGKYQEKSSRP